MGAHLFELLTTVAFEQTVLKKHSDDAEWLHTQPLPLWPYGYEWIYRNDEDRLTQIKKSDDYFVRYRPDYKTELARLYLLDLKSSLGWIQALSLTINAGALKEKRPFPVFYLIERRFGVFAEDLVARQTDYFSHLQIWTKKQERPEALSDRWMKVIRQTFSELEEIPSNEDVGWVNNRFLRSGDPALKFKDGAPLESWENFLKRLDSR